MLSGFGGAETGLHESRFFALCSFSTSTPLSPYLTLGQATPTFALARDFAHTADNQAARIVAQYQQIRTPTLRRSARNAADNLGSHAAILIAQVLPPAVKPSFGVFRHHRI